MSSSKAKELKDPIFDLDPEDDYDVVSDNVKYWIRSHRDTFKKLANGKSATPSELKSLAQGVKSMVRL